MVSGPDGVLGEIPGLHPRDQGSIHSVVFSLFSTFTLFYPFLEIFKGQKRGGIYHHIPMGPSAIN